MAGIPPDRDDPATELSAKCFFALNVFYTVGIRRPHRTARQHRCGLLISTAHLKYPLQDHFRTSSSFSNTPHLILRFSPLTPCLYPIHPHAFPQYLYHARPFPHPAAMHTSPCIPVKPLSLLLPYNLSGVFYCQQFVQVFYLFIDGTA